MKSTSACGTCGKKPMADVVKCSDCGQAFHFDCVEEDETVLDREWYCEPCCNKDFPPAEEPRDVELEQREVDPLLANPSTSRIRQPTVERREVYPPLVEQQRTTEKKDRAACLQFTAPSTIFVLFPLL